MLREWARLVKARLWTLPMTHRTYKNLSVAETFSRIYRLKMWGDDGQQFRSGAGSRGRVVEQYCSFVADFIREHQVKSVVDLGCGDFAVGQRIVESCDIRYTGIDVVPELIEHHKATVLDPRVSFGCADITTDKLPLADLCLVRQVLQHLSNQEIAKVLANLGSFSMVLVSEHLPVRPRSFNRDKPHGPDARFYWGSGVYIDQPPFSKRVAKLWEIPLGPNSILRTTLLENPVIGQ